MSQTCLSCRPQECVRTFSPNQFVYGFLRGRDLGDLIACQAACVAARALDVLPNWQTTSAGRLELTMWLFRTLVDAGCGTESAQLTADLLRELSLGTESIEAAAAPARYS